MCLIPAWCSKLCAGSNTVTSLILDDWNITARARSGPKRLGASRIPAVRSVAGGDIHPSRPLATKQPEPRRAAILIEHEEGSSLGRSPPFEIS